MKKINIKMIARQISTGLLAIVMLFAFLPNAASAGAITARSVVIGSSVASANTTYTFTMTAPSGTTIKSIKFSACDSPNFASCVHTGASNGFSVSTPGSALVSQPTGLGIGTWSVDNTSQYDLRVKNDGTNNTGPSAGAQVKFQTVHNPTATNSTYYFQITTYSDVAWTTPIDTGAVATSTAGLVTVNANVDETLTFTLATTTVALNSGASMTTGAASTGTSTMTAATNATGGYTIAYTGSTLAGPTTITAMSTAGASNPGNKQFGLNLMANTGGRGGTAVSGAGSGTPWTTADYGTADTFKFLSGDTVAHATAPTNSNTFTVDYLANIDAATPAGAYTTNVNYVATANF
jgi:hypothetical protein